MATHISPTVVDLPAPAPLPYGLYSAAIVQDVPVIRGGVVARPSAHLATGSAEWDMSCDPAPENPPKAGAELLEPSAGQPFGVYAAHECKTVGVPEQEALGHAVNALAVVEQMKAEEHLATRLAAAESTTAGGDAAMQIDTAEKALAVFNTPGVVHAPRWRLREFDKAGAVIRQGQALFTPGGHRWVFGSGYEALQGSIAVTGRVLVQRDPINSAVTVDHKNNNRLAIAERALAIAVEAPTTIIEGA